MTVVDLLDGFMVEVQLVVGSLIVTAMGAATAFSETSIPAV